MRFQIKHCDSRCGERQHQTNRVKW